MVFVSISIEMPPCISPCVRIWNYELNDEIFCLDILKMIVDIFKMIIGIGEPTKELVNRELQMFWKYQIDAKTLSVL